jgi:hypothetical protein
MKNGGIAMAVIRNVRDGTVGWNEEDRLALANILIKAGYTVRIDHRLVPGEVKKKEYVVIYEESEKRTE